MIGVHYSDIQNNNSVKALRDINVIQCNLLSLSLVMAGQILLPQANRSKSTILLGKTTLLRVRLDKQPNSVMSYVPPLLFRYS